MTGIPDPLLWEGGPKKLVTRVEKPVHFTAGLFKMYFGAQAILSRFLAYDIAEFCARILTTVQYNTLSVLAKAMSI